MGFRFRKSIKLGGGFRINLSKSGIGYSWGTKHMRFTKTAKGTKRRTFSIPGTGISYVSETKKKRTSKINNNFVPKPSQHFSISSSPINQQQTEGHKSDMEKTIKKIKNILLWGLTVWFALMAVAFLPQIAGFFSLIVALLLAPI